MAIAITFKFETKKQNRHTHERKGPTAEDFLIINKSFIIGVPWVKEMGDLSFEESIFNFYKKLTLYKFINCL